MRWMPNCRPSLLTLAMVWGTVTPLCVGCGGDSPEERHLEGSFQIGDGRSDGDVEGSNVSLGARCEADDTVRGDQPLETREVIVAAPEAVQIRTLFDAKLTVDPQHEGDVTLRIRTHANLFEHVVSEVVDGTLAVGLESGHYCDIEELSVEAVVAPLRSVSASGHSRVQVDGLTGQDVALGASGTSELLADGEARHWQVESSGDSSVKLDCGESAGAKASVSGSSTAELRCDSIEELHVALSGSAHADLGGEVETLELEMSGASTATGTAAEFAARQAILSLSGASRASLCVHDEVRGDATTGTRAKVSCGAVVAID